MLTKKGILSLINSNLKFKRVEKDRLFYDRYQYCLGFQLGEVSCLRELDHDYIDLIIARRRQWRQVSIQHWGVGLNKNILARRDREIADETVVDLHTLADTLLNSNTDFKLITSVNNAWIYTNDLQFLETVDGLDFLILKQYTEAQVNRPKDTVRLHNPKHRHRSYLSNQKLTSDEKAHLLNFFVNQQEHIRPSPSLIAFLEGSFHRMQDYFFFDYNEESWLVMLALIRPGLIRKTMDIIAR